MKENEETTYQNFKMNKKENIVYQDLWDEAVNPSIEKEEMS